MSVGSKNITADEFARYYEKQGQGSLVDSTLADFILFKLKVADALNEKLDTTKSFKTTVKAYRDQLASGYLIDQKTKEDLILEEYDRLMTELHVWHILVQCQSNASPADTMEAWGTATKIRDRIIKGELFETVAKASSDDPTVKSNGGDLGYITAFQTTMPFENAAYSLPIGELSNPVRSAEGYHIIKVTDKRPAQGSVLVQHIMKSLPVGYTGEEDKEVEAEINAIYDKLKNGESFDELARTESDHSVSASNGGRLDWFSAGETIKEFAEAAFALTEKGDFSKPVKTPAGWHIIKLIDKKAPPSFEEAKPYLESQLMRTSLLSQAREALINNLKTEYSYEIDQASVQWFVNNSDTLVTRGQAYYDPQKVPEGTLYRFADQQISNSTFATYVRNRGPVVKTDEPDLFVDAMIKASTDERILMYEDSRLEEKYPEITGLVSDFSDDILAFEISELKMWDRGNSDTSGLKEFYEANKTDYLSIQSIDAKIYTYLVRGGDKALSKAYNKYSRKVEGDKLMAEKLNNKNDTLLIIEQGTWESAQKPELESIDWKRGTEKTTINGYPSIVKITEVNQPKPLPFADVRELMLERFTQTIGNRWIEQLKTDYPVKVNNSVLEVIKNEFR
jgi:peptidyl-prolyl cis-trans isomerase SurA